MPFVPKGYEWLVILIAVIIFLGPVLIPKIKRTAKKNIKGIRKGVEEGKAKLDEKLDEKFEEVEAEKAEAATAKPDVDAAEGTTGKATAHAGVTPTDASHQAEEESDVSESGQPKKKTVKVRKVVKD